MKCQDYPNMVFKGTLHYEGHSVTFNVFDDYVEVTNVKNATNEFFLYTFQFYLIFFNTDRNARVFFVSFLSGF